MTAIEPPFSPMPTHRPAADRPFFPPSGPRALWRTFWTHWELIQQMGFREVVGRYKGSIFGLLWSFANPLFMLAVYTFAFAYILKIAPRGAQTTGGDIVEFALFAFAGMILFGMFTEVLTRATGCIIQNTSYVKKVVFPLEIFPIVYLVAALAHAFISTILLAVAAWVLHGTVSWTIVLLPIAVLPMLLMCLGFAWFLASLGVYLRDMSQIIGIIIPMLMYLSPVFYSIKTAQDRTPILAAIIRLNPLTVPLENFRACVLGPTVNGGASGADFAPMSWTIGYAIASLVIAWGGFFFFQRTKRGFADVI